MQETIPDYILKEYNLMGLNNAIRKIHFPENKNDFVRARYRLVFEELLSFQLALSHIKQSYKTDEKGIAFDKKVKMMEVINTLPFKLTNAQIRVLKKK